MKSEQPFDLEKYLAEGTEHFVRGALRATLKNPKESAFLVQYGAAVKRGAARRHQLEAQGEHIPSFLIASIAAECNLHCAGCYAEAAGPCASGQLSAAEWGAVFDEAAGLGVAMVLLAGGEPLTRRDVIAEAAARRQLAFPIFTNGTLLDDETLELFGANRNLVPIVSIEGGEAATDARRGAGVYAKTQAAMAAMQKRGLLFGASVTVTSENLADVTAEAFAAGLYAAGCKVLLFISYVPVDQRDIALSPAEEARLDEGVQALRAAFEDMIIVSFPGDEKEAGGCLAAGRGFIHISAGGAAEPCPFSPYSDVNLREAGLRGALKSPLFTKLREAGILQEEHSGGCVLFRRAEEVQRLL